MKKEHRHLGSYGILIRDDKILLIRKCVGPYDGKLDLPGGSLEFGENPELALVREFKEEVGIDIIKYELIDADSVNLEWNYKNEIINVHHIGIFYKINMYDGVIKKENIVDEINDDSLGADFYEIKKLTKDELSKIAYMEINKL